MNRLAVAVVWGTALTFALSPTFAQQAELYWGDTHLDTCASGISAEARNPMESGCEKGGSIADQAATRSQQPC